MIELVVRLVFSLAVVVGLLLVLAKFSAKRFRGNGDALVRVVHRQSLSRTSSVSVVTVGSRILVLGATEHQVQLLTELDPDEIDVPELGSPELGSPELGSPELDEAELEERPARIDRPRELTVVGRHAAPRRSATPGALGGSVLSTETWKQAFAAATGRERAAS